MSFNEKYKIIHIINTGEYGQVFKICDINNVEYEYAAKVISNKVDINIDNEIAILQKIKHLNGVLKYIEHFTTRNYIIIITEYIKGCELLSVIDKRSMSENEIRGIFYNLCTCLTQVHAIGVIHRDLKLENIMISDKGMPIIIDWGFALLYKDVADRTSCGSPCYAAPELYKKEYYIGPEVDIWGLGVLLYLMIFRVYPFGSDDDINILYNNIININVTYPICDIKHVIKIMKKIFVYKHKRISLQKILSHKWFKIKK